MLTTSNLTTVAIELKFELFISSLISNIWQVALISDGNSLANSTKIFSTKIDVFQCGVTATCYNTHRFTTLTTASYNSHFA